MQSLISLLTLENLESLSSSSHFRYGQNMAKNGEIKIVEENRFNVTASVVPPAGQPRTVEFHATAKGLRWKCSCSNKKNFFCNHCVAVGLFLSVSKETAE